MKRQPIIEPFDFPEEVQNSIIAAIQAQKAKMPFLVNLGKEGRKGLLKVETGKATKQKGVHKILVENPTVNKSENLSVTNMGKGLGNYDSLFSIHKAVQQFADTIYDTLLANGHELAHQGNDGQKQITRAANDNAEYEHLLAELKNIKPPAKPTQKQLDKMAAKQGLIKPPTL